MTARYHHPPPERVASALLAAVFATAAPLVVTGSVEIVFSALLVGAAHALLFGWPPYLLLRQRFAIDWGASLIAGLLIGAVPAGMLGALFLVTRQLFPMESQNPHAIAVSPWTVLGIMTFLGVAGMGGGAVFRLVLGAPEPIPEPVDPGIFE